MDASMISHETEILSRVIGPENPSLNDEAARFDPRASFQRGGCSIV